MPQPWNKIHTVLELLGSIIDSSQRENKVLGTILGERKPTRTLSGVFYSYIPIPKPIKVLIIFFYLYSSSVTPIFREAMYRNSISRDNVCISLFSSDTLSKLVVVMVSKACLCHSHSSSFSFKKEINALSSHSRERICLPAHFTKRHSFPKLICAREI